MALACLSLKKKAFYLHDALPFVWVFSGGGNQGLSRILTHKFLYFGADAPHLNIAKGSILAFGNCMKWVTVIFVE